jgi:hypothetical protein
MNPLSLTILLFKTGPLILVFLLMSTACSTQPNPSYDNLFDKQIVMNWLNEVTSNTASFYNPSYQEVYGNLFDEENENDHNEPMSWPREYKDAAIILVTHDTYCGFCIAELDFWNNLYNNDDQGFLNKINILMVVVDAENDNFQHFLARNRYNLPAIMDSNRRIEEIVERFYIPLKLLILTDGTIADVSQIGGQDDIYRYISFVKRQIR